MDAVCHQGLCTVTQQVTLHNGSVTETAMFSRPHPLFFQTDELEHTSLAVRWCQVPELLPVKRGRNSLF